MHKPHGRQCEKSAADPADSALHCGKTPDLDLTWRSTRMQYRRISADCHLDLPWLPKELFVSEASRELKDRMPYVEERPDGPRWVTKSGIDMGGWGGVGSVGGQFVPGQNYRVDKMAETGLYEAGSAARRARVTRIFASRRWKRTGSMPRSSSASSASSPASKTMRRPASACASTTIS